MYIPRFKHPKNWHGILSSMTALERCLPDDMPSLTLDGQFDILNRLELQILQSLIDASDITVFKFPSQTSQAHAPRFPILPLSLPSDPIRAPLLPIPILLCPDFSDPSSKSPSIS
mmetsp:Transcript_60691/g.179974  ORF Transcript_60691/g.179974 Transcript_60691/m.179974 type:complete len:115 (-) Transcript_60691:217-561(-)